MSNTPRAEAIAEGYDAAHVRVVALTAIQEPT